MSNIEALKEQARRHEQDEEWQKACDLYLRALDRQGHDEEPDIGLHNRIGDLQIRLGAFDDAVEHYERAVDLYVESGLPNNAIAVCKKVLRHLPQRAETHLRMGQIRAAQGFLVDARGHFLTYAEKMQAAGHTEEALEALVEFAGLAPEDTEIRMAVALQLLQHDRPGEALDQLAQGYRALMERGDEEAAAAFRAKIVALDPDADLQALLEAAPDQEATAGNGTRATVEVVSGDPLGIPLAEPGVVDLAIEATALGDLGAGEEVQGFGDLEVEGNQVSIEPGPAVDDGGDDEDEEDLGGDLPLIPVGLDEAPDGSVESPTTVTPRPDPAEAWSLLRDRVAREGGVDGAEELVEKAFLMDDSGALVESYLLLAHALGEAGEADRSRAVLRQVLSLDPENARAHAGLAAEEDDVPPLQASGEEEGLEAPEPDGGFVDLGALVLDQPRGTTTTRFTVEYEEPSGDEDADFSRVLDQFKAKVSENFDYADVRAHHDLGTAYKEMGLLGEAVEKYQQALRAAPTHLPTYELLGQVFMEQGEDRAAVRVLERALRVPTQVDDEMVGIYYYLARAHEKLGNTGEALEFYDRVFALDINFADVTDRLRRLR